jgi:tRNA threonylcarbamoyladenosine biosynthesis protein TsaE
LRTERSSSAAETEAIGARLSAALQPGDVVLVGGELGVGKTTLIRGASRELGVTDPVVSPTFTIGRRYRGRVPVSHLDLFRIEDVAEEDPGLLDDYLTPDSIAFVEWQGKAEPLDEPPALRVGITHEGGDRRLVVVQGQRAGPCRR